jgi:hypothetical protein
MLTQSTTGKGMVHTVDIFDGKTRTWSTARLSESRASLAATSLPSQGLAIFAGGFNGALLVQTAFCRLIGLGTTAHLSKTALKL